MWIGIFFLRIRTQLFLTMRIRTQLLLTQFSGVEKDNKHCSKVKVKKNMELVY